MKSGDQVWDKKIQKVVDSYADAHVSRDCGDKFQFRVVQNVIYPLGALGPLQAPIVPMIVCDGCGAGYVYPQFEENVSRIIAERLVLSKEMLSKRQIRFLRQFFDLTQEQLSDRIGVFDRHEMSKLESEKYPTKQMQPDTQLRMKLTFAKILGVKEVDKIYELIDQDESRTVEVDPSCFESASEKQKLAK